MDYGLASSLDFGFDTRTLDWDDELINAMGLDKRLFPRLHPNTEPLGVVSAKAAAETGVQEGVSALSCSCCRGHSVGQGFYSMGSGANMTAITDN